jgi:ABC-type polar amino acid transport system ATPase subunit
VAIARALAVEPPVLLLDEPTASLDPARRTELGQALKALAAAGRTLLLTSHDDDFVRDFSTRVVILANGRVVEEGEPRRVLDHAEHEETRRLLQVERGRKDR